MIKNRIPHIYHNTKYAYKIFEIIKNKQIKIREIFNTLSFFNDLDKSSGYLLDVLGGNFKISRNGLNDVDYKKILKFEMKLRHFLGSPEDIRTVLSEYFNLNSDEFRILELSGKVLISIPDQLPIFDVKEVVKKIKGAGVGLEVKYGVYVEDYLISELHEMSLEEIEKITLARESYYIELYTLQELSSMTLEEIENLKIARR